MKVVEVYTKKDLDVLTCRGKVVSKIMDDFFSMFPREYRENYDKNLNKLEIWKMDEMHEGNTSGEYYEPINVMLIRNLGSIIHELMHVASRNHKTGLAAFQRMKYANFCENALIEGITEYFAGVALDSTPSDYHFETFSAAMLSNIEGVFQSYFIPSYDNFIACFPEKKHILSLMYALTYYASKLEGLRSDDSKKIDDHILVRVDHSIKDVINSLIDIQLSMKMSKKENMIYGEKFMDLIGSEVMDDCLGIFSEDYMDYANEQINKRVLRRLR